MNISCTSEHIKIFNTTVSVSIFVAGPSDAYIALQQTSLISKLMGCGFVYVGIYYHIFTMYTS